MPSLDNTSRIGVLITNLGTPDAPTPDAVKKYLSEFLSDPYVVRIPKLLWWPLLHGLILPLRAKKSAKLYEKIWTPAGSPLLALSKELTQKLKMKLDQQPFSVKVALGMRYGSPSLFDALKALHQEKATDLLVIPLYPQYSTTTTLSTEEAIPKHLSQLDWEPRFHMIQNYAALPQYIEAIAHSIKTHWQKYTPGEKLVFSFHGIPQKNVERGDPYFDQCQSTAKRVAEKLQLANDRWDVVFQSRFGREEWLQPYCDAYLRELPKRGYRRIDVICPGFAVDCLETLEEIALTNKDIFCQAGGLIYHYIPALNATDPHVEMLLGIILSHVETNRLVMD